MSIAVERVLEELPGLRAWLGAVVASLEEGRHVMINTGGAIRAELLAGLLRGRCLDASTMAMDVAVFDDRRCDPPQMVGETIGDGTPGPYRPASSIRDEAEDDRVCAFADTLAMGEEGGRWRTYFVEVARHGWASRHRLVLIENHEPEGFQHGLRGTDVAIHHLSGVPSVLETRLLCRNLLDGQAITPAQRWREAVLPGLVAPDVELLEALWEPVVKSWREVVQVIRAHAGRRGIDPALLTAMKVREGEQLTTDRVGELERRGLLQRTPEYGDELSITALVGLEAEKALQHRLWRGQAALLLPVLDDLRMHGCRQLSSVLSKDWPLRYPNLLEEDRGRVMEDPLSTDYPALDWVLRNEVGNSALRQAPVRALREAVGFARRLRNHLAHYRPIEFVEFEKLLALRQAAGGSL